MMFFNFDHLGPTQNSSLRWSSTWKETQAPMVPDPGKKGSGLQDVTSKLSMVGMEEEMRTYI